MIDEIFDRHYRGGRNELNASVATGLSRFRRAVAETFRVLNRIEYQAPWTTSAKRARSN